MPIYQVMQHTLALGRWLGRIRGETILYKGAVTVCLAARITSQVLLLSQRREYRAGAAGRVKQFEEFYLGKKKKKCCFLLSGAPEA